MDNQTTLAGMEEIPISTGEKRKVLLTRTSGMPMVSIREVKNNGVRNLVQEITLVDEEISKVALELMRPAGGAQVQQVLDDEQNLGSLAVILVTEALQAVVAFKKGDVLTGIDKTSESFKAASRLRWRAHAALALKKQIDQETKK